MISSTSKKKPIDEKLILLSMKDFLIISDPLDPPRIEKYNPKNTEDRKKLEEKGKFEYVLDYSLSFIGTSPLTIFFNFNNPYAGLGVVSNTFYQAGEYICDYVGEKRKKDYVKDAYAIRVNKNKLITALKIGSTGRFINHNPTLANVTAVVDPVGDIHIEAIRPIHPGEQLFYHYGDDYWRALKITPAYINHYENGMEKAEFLTKYQSYYDFERIKPITVKDITLFNLETKATHMIIPKIFYDAKQNTLPNLPIILVRIENNTIIVAETQPFLTTLMLACQSEKIELIKEIIKTNVDMFAETTTGLSALSILSKLSHTLQSEIFNLFIQEMINKKLFGSEFKKDEQNTYTKNNFFHHVQKHVTDATSIKVILDNYPRNILKRKKQFSEESQPIKKECSDYKVDMTSLPLDTACSSYSEIMTTLYPSLDQMLFNYLNAPLKDTTSYSCSLPLSETEHYPKEKSSDSQDSHTKEKSSDIAKNFILI